MKKIAYFFALLLAANVILSSCTDDIDSTTITLNRMLLELMVGSSETLVAIVTPDNDNTRLTWTSSNSIVAFVDDFGVVTARSLGTATITVTTPNGAYATCTVIVIPNPGIDSPTATTDPGVVINNIRWATRNVNTVGTFAAAPESSGMLFQWNRRTAWASTGTVSGWSNSAAEGTIWESENDPCPTGWRVPTRYEFQSLFAPRVIRNWTTQDGVNGVVFGEAPNQLFLPASGLRNTSGALIATNEQGGYWSSTHLTTSTNVNALFLNNTHLRVGIASSNRAQGFSVRCVEDISISVSSIALDQTEMTLPVTSVAFPLVATVSPANATDTRVVWTSSNNAIASVNTYGVVTAVAIGNATITATTMCGAHMETVAVTVTAIPAISASLDGVVINDIRWATRNVDAPGTFARSPQDAGMFYQWNRHIGWFAADPLFPYDGNAIWDNTNPTEVTWNPCPAGWRVPNLQELQSLNSAGSVWLTYNGVHGRLYGTPPAVIFLPAMGWRSSTGVLNNVADGGFYWSSTRYDDTHAMGLWFGSHFSFMSEYRRTLGHLVRCVADD